MLQVLKEKIQDLRRERIQNKLRKAELEAEEPAPQ